MSCVVLDNSFKTLSPFIDALVNKMSATVCSTHPPKQVSVGQRSQTGVASKLFINYIIIRHHKHVHRIVNYTKQPIVNYEVGVSFLK